jgi:hypothetical protein
MAYASVALSACVALGLAFGATARAEQSAPPADPSVDPAASHVSLPAQQARLADATLKLERAFDDQFVHGAIDRTALSGPIESVLRAMPEEARPKVQTHIANILQGAEKLAAEMTPAQRAEATVPPVLETIGSTRQAQIAAWGWPGAAGFGGLGAFGFPGMFGYGTGYGVGYGSGYSCGYNSQSVNGFGYGTGGCVPYGYGVGDGGWYF